jgi:hypothetical protein
MTSFSRISFESVSVLRSVAGFSSTKCDPPSYYDQRNRTREVRNSRDAVETQRDVLDHQALAEGQHHSPLDECGRGRHFRGRNDNHIFLVCSDSVARISAVIQRPWKRELPDIKERYSAASPDSFTLVHHHLNPVERFKPRWPKYFLPRRVFPVRSRYRNGMRYTCPSNYK